MIIDISCHVEPLNFVYMDVHEPEVRSYNMSRIRSKDTKPEMLVRRALFAQGFRFRLHTKELPGKPDIVLPKHHTVIFVHGCFWHGHQGCKYFVVPKTRTEWWTDKIAKNRIKDANDKNLLIQENWEVITIFECELKPLERDKTLNKLHNTLRRISVNE